MIWKGRDLNAPQHYLDAMREIVDVNEAQEFLNAWERENPTARRDAGYLTGYAEHDRGIAMRALFQVEHPIMGDLVPEREGRDLTFDELLNLGMQFAEYHYAKRMSFDAAAGRARDDVRALRELREGQTDGARPATD
jgi:hypothetical protein